MKLIKLYKATGKNTTCKNLTYIKDKLYEFEGEVVFSKSGYHACLNILDVFALGYSAEDIYEVWECEGHVVHRKGNDVVCDKIVLRRRLTPEEIYNKYKKRKNYDIEPLLWWVGLRTNSEELLYELSRKKFHADDEGRPNLCSHLGSNLHLPLALMSKLLRLDSYDVTCSIMSNIRTPEYMLYDISQCFHPQFIHSVKETIEYQRMIYERLKNEKIEINNHITQELVDIVIKIKNPIDDVVVGVQKRSDMGFLVDEYTQNRTLHQHLWEEPIRHSIDFIIDFIILRSITWEILQMRFSERLIGE